LLAPESALNLFIIGDIENNGFEADFQDVWGDVDADGRLRGVLLRYFGSFIPYAPGEFDLDGFAGILRDHRDRMRALSGIERVVSRFEGYPHLIQQPARRRTLFFMELRSGERLEAMKRKVPFSLERAVPDDVPAILNLWRHIEGFQATEDSERMMRHELEQGSRP